MAELKPCPFCGGRASMKKFVSKNGAFEIYNVYCMNEDCRVEPITHDYFHKEEAIEAWNNRVENEELKFTREFIHKHGLEFDLASAWERRKKDGK